MKKLLLLPLLFLVGCNGPTQPSIPYCQSHNMGTVVVQNNYTTPVEVLIDKIDFGVVKDGRDLIVPQLAGPTLVIWFFDPGTRAVIGNPRVVDLTYPCATATVNVSQ